jgi:hypothetical protein
MQSPTLLKQFERKTRTEQKLIEFVRRFGNLQQPKIFTDQRGYEALCEWTDESLNGCVLELPKYKNINGVACSEWLQVQDELNDIRNEFQAIANPSDESRDLYTKHLQESYQFNSEHFGIKMKLMSTAVLSALNVNLHLNAHLMEHVSIQIDVGRRQFVIVPTDLRGALYMRLGAELCDIPLDERVCKECGAISYGRSDRKYCSDACRQRAHRKDTSKSI